MHRLARRPNACAPSAALRESEARLRELNENLEQRIDERTRELEQAHSALRQAQKMEAVGQLTGGIAHDFNNLLQGITGNLDLIRRKPDDPDRVGRWADAGLKAAERGARLAGQLLAFSRTQKLELTSIDITSAVTGFADMLRRSIGPAVRIQMDLKTDGVYVRGDQVQLEMAVLNLALNARDAMPDGGELAIATRTCRLRGRPRAAGRRLRRAVGRRFRQGHERGRGRARVRAVLHDQGSRQGHRSRPEPGLRHAAPVGRRSQN